MDQPRVSIITPSYNQGQFIAETINSVLTQNYANLEYIIIDGGSTDQTLEVIRRYADDPRLSWISEPDEGMSHALNKGFARCTGEFMTWLNSDDVFIGQPVPETVAYFQANPQAVLVYGQAMFTKPDGSPCEGVDLMGSPFDFVKMLSGENVCIPQPGTFWRRSLWEQVGAIREDLQYVMDCDYWLRASRYGELHYIPHLYSACRQHEEAKTVKHDVLAWLEREKLYQELRQLPDLYPEVVQYQRLIESDYAWNLAQVLARKGDDKTARVYLKRALRQSPPRLRMVLMLFYGIDLWSGVPVSEYVNAMWRKLKGV